MSQPVEQDVKPADSLNGWGAVMDAAVQLGLIAAAPQVALPAGVLGVAGMLYRAWRSKRGNNAQEPRQIVRQETVREVPVVVATDTPPPPAKVVQTSHYVPIENQSHREAWQWAADNYARKYPGSEGLIQTLNSMISQYETSKQEGK
jgi:hypothetical protein